jgi:hypothetical protein
MQAIGPNNSEGAPQQALTELATSSIGTLRSQWRALFSTPPPPAFGPDLLRRSIAFKLQEQVYGARSTGSQRDLDRLIAAIEKAPAGKIALPRRIKPGAVLIRDWKGKSHRVTVLENGFIFEDKTYASLSEIARTITGTRWNGPRFFGLRVEASAQRQECPDVDTQKQPRGRPRKRKRNRSQTPTLSQAHHGH